MSDRTSTSPFFVRVRTSSGNVAMFSPAAPRDEAKNLGSSACRGVFRRMILTELPPADSHRSEVRREPLSADTPGGGRTYVPQLRDRKGHGRTRREAAPRAAPDAGRPLGRSPDPREVPDSVGYSARNSLRPLCHRGD